jgi:hypothetical protein
MLIVRVANILGKPWGVNPFPRAHANPATCGEVGRQRAFDNIFRNAGWGSRESVSGVGSEAANAKKYVSELAYCLRDLGAHSIFDAPCGDLNWILPAVAGLDYTGGDISPALIESLRPKHPGLALRVFDICEDEFPRADVWHCRDCLFHLPLADVKRSLINFIRSDIPYALLTTHRSRLLHRNLDIPVGGWRYLDLEQPPFSLPRPKAYLRDFRFGRDFPRFVGLWTRQQVSEALR